MLILGGDKTTVSVATGHMCYWPLYLLVGNIHNNVRRGHRNNLVLLGFLVIPKSMLLVFSPFAVQWLKKCPHVSQVLKDSVIGRHILNIRPNAWWLT